MTQLIRQMTIDDFAEDDNDLERQPEEFIINSDERADWFLAKVQALVDEQRRLNEAHRLRTELVTKQLLHLEARHLQDFENYMAWRLAQEGKKCHILDHGEVKSRTVPPSIAVTDEKAAREYIADMEADSQERYLIVTEVLDKAAYGKEAMHVLAEDAEILPGCTYTAKHDSLSYDGRDVLRKAREVEAKRKSKETPGVVPVEGENPDG